MRASIIAIVTVATLVGVAAAHDGRGGIVGHPGGGAPRPTPSFNRPAPREMPNNFRQPEARNVRLGERPSFGGIGNNYRPGAANSFVGERPAARPVYGNGLGGVNRSNINNSVVNRSNINNSVVNRTNVVNVNRNVTNVINNNVGRPGHFGYRPGYGGWGGGYGGWYRPNPYYGYHAGWVNGYWNGNYGGGWNNFGNSALGWGIGIGVAAWGIGSMMNAWGYSSYMNPYYGGSAVVYQQPAKDVRITLALNGGRGFTWTVNDHGQPHQFQGNANFENDTLALQAADQPPMVGKVTWTDDSHFQFKALGGPPDDTGLTFGR